MGVQREKYQLDYQYVTLNSRAVHPSPLPQGEGEQFSALRSIERASITQGMTAVLPLPKGEGERNATSRINCGIGQYLSLRSITKPGGLCEQ